MQHVLRPYATAGVVLVGASVLVVTPLAVPPPRVQAWPVHLADAWSDLVADTSANLTNISDGADSTAISAVYSALGTNPVGVIDAFTNLTPTITGDLPGPLTVDLPPGLELGLAGLGAWGATLEAIQQVAGQVAADPSSIFEAPATVLNAFLNGEDNVSLLNGSIDITGLNGILAPMQDVSIDLNPTSLLDALGLGDVSIGSTLLGQLGLGDLTLGGLVSDLGLSGDGLGTLLGDPTLSGLLGDLGLSNLGLGSFSLSSLLSDLGLNTSLNNLTLDSVLSAFGIDPTINLGLPTLLTDLGLGSFVSESLGTVLASLPSSLLTDAVDSLGASLNTLITSIPALAAAFTAAGLNPDDLLTVSDLETALSGITVGDLLGGQSIDASVSSLLGDLGVSAPTSGLTIGGILTDLGVSSSTTDLTLGGLLTDLGAGDTGISALLNTVNLGDLLTDLGISGTAINLGDIGDLSGLTLGGLLSDLNLGDITLDVNGIGGLVTELVDVIPQQILSSLGS